MSASDDSSLFANTKQALRAAVALFNGLDGGKALLVLARILGGLGGAKGERVFLEAEEAQLRELLGLDEAALADRLGACAFVFEQAAYGPTAPERLRAELAGAGVEGGPADAFAAVRQEEGAAPSARASRSAPSSRRSTCRPSPGSSACAPPAAAAAARGGRTACCSSTCARPRPPRRPTTARATHVIMQLGVPELERLLHKLDAVQGQLDAGKGADDDRMIMLNFVCRHHADHCGR